MTEEGNRQGTTFSETSALEVASCIISWVINPIFMPTLAFILLSLFTHLNIMPLPFHLFVMALVVSFTILTPCLFIYIYKRIHHWSFTELSQRKRRFVPYMLTIMSYITCLLTMYKLHFPHYFMGIITATILCLIFCMLINLKWKISTHTAASGLMIGGLFSYSLVFFFNPIWWLCIFILVAGIVGSAQLILRQQTLLEVLVGFIAGLFCGIIGILFI